MEVIREYVEGFADENDPSTRWASFVYEFRANGAMLFGRQWEDLPIRAELLHQRDRTGVMTLFRAVPYDDDLFCDAVRYFLDIQRVREVVVLLFTEPGVSPTFLPVEMSKLHSSEIQ